jgi:hypothetical protein
MRVGLWCLTPLSTIFQLCRGCQFYWWRKPEYSGKTIDLLYNLINVHEPEQKQFFKAANKSIRKNAIGQILLKEHFSNIL